MVYSIHCTTIHHQPPCIITQVPGLLIISFKYGVRCRYCGVQHVVNTHKDVYQTFPNNHTVAWTHLSRISSTFAMQNAFYLILTSEKKKQKQIFFGPYSACTVYRHYAIQFDMIMDCWFFFWFLRWDEFLYVAMCNVHINIWFIINTWPQNVFEPIVDGDGVRS